LIAPLRAGAYALRRPIGAAVRRPLAAAAIVLAVAAAIVAVGSLRLVTNNLAAALTRAPVAPQLVVYLEPSVNPERIAAIGEAIAAVPATLAVRRVSAAEARAELELALGEDATALDELAPELLPASLEVSLRGGVRDVAAAHPFIGRLESLDGVEAVEVLGDWSERTAALVDGLAAVAEILLFLFAGAAAFVVAALMRLAAAPDPREAALLERLGAGLASTVGARATAGAIQGAAGGALACLILFSLYLAAAPAAAALLSGTIGGGSLAFLPAVELAALAGGGAAIGAIGAALAAPRR
jgi:cell division transport system permease protein